MNRGRGLLFDVNLPLREVVNDGQSLTANHTVSKRRGIGALGAKGLVELTVAIETHAGNSIRGSSDAPERYSTQDVM